MFLPFSYVQQLSLYLSPSLSFSLLLSPSLSYSLSLSFSLLSLTLSLSLMLFLSLSLFLALSFSLSLLFTSSICSPFLPFSLPFLTNTIFYILLSLRFISLSLMHFLPPTSLYISLPLSFLYSRL